MTCIAAIVDSNKKIWMGGDSCFTMGDTKTLNAQPKVFLKESPDGTRWAFGCSGYARYGQIVRYHVDLPGENLGSTDPYEYLVKHWIPILRSRARDEGGIVMRDSAEEGRGHILIGVNGKLYFVDSGFSITVIDEPFLCIGSGSTFAEGVLWSLEDQKSRLTSEERIRNAIESSILHASGVGGRVDVIST